MNRATVTAALVCAACSMLIAPWRGVAAAEPPTPPNPSNPSQPSEPFQPRERPRAAQRVVAHFDFEEMDDNPTPVPRFWVRAQDDPDAPRVRPGFPRWNAAELDYERAASGRGSVRLPTQGGSTSLMLERGVVPVFPGADYRVSALVRTEGLSHARPFLVARFLDRDGEPIEGARVRGEPEGSEGEWRPVQADLYGLHPDAAYMQLELALLQPEQARGVAKPREQDLTGAAWFDEVRVVMLPRLDLECAAAGLFRGDEPVVINAQVRDLAGEELELELVVRDDAGVEVLRAQERAAAGRSTTAFAAPLPRLGWYRAEVIARSGGAEIARSVIDLCRMANGERSGASLDRGSFEAGLRELSPELATELVELVRRAGLGGVSIPAWPLVERPAEEQMALLRAVVGPLVEDGRSVTLTLDRVPEPAAVELRIDSADVWAALASDHPSVRSVLDPLLERFGHRVARWRIGSLDNVHGLRLAADPEAARVLLATFSRLVPGPTLVVPWPASAAAMDGVPGVEPLVGLGGAPSESVAELLTPWSSGAGGVLPRHDLGCLSARDAAADIVRRFVEAWAAHGERRERPGRLVVDEPWERTGGPRPRIMPRPELAAVRAVSDRLSGRRVVGELPVAPGVRCFILQGADGSPGALAAWNERAADEEAVLRANLGAGPLRLVDMYGNEQELSASGAATIPISRLPMFVEGVDVALSRFLASVRIEPSAFSAAAGVHEHEVRFRNHWPRAIEGRVLLLGPVSPETAGEHAWRIAPRTVRFEAARGEEVVIPFTASLGPGARAGRLPFVLDFEMEADRVYDALRVRAPMELVIPGFRIEATCSAAPTSDGPDLVVEAVVYNESSGPARAELTIFAPGLPRERRALGEIAAGERAVRRVIFPGAAERLKGRELVVSLIDPEQRARLNLVVKAP